MISDDAVLDMIIAAEGTTYTDDPLDAGGPTKFGITLRELASWRRHPVTPQDVANLERPEANALYRERYIRPFAILPDGLRQNVVDMGVNAGQDRAARLCQQLIGVAVDGVIGPATAHAAMFRDWTEPYTFMRIAFYERLIEAKPSQIKWRNGWRARALRFSDVPTTAVRLMVSAYMAYRVGKAYE